MLHSSCGTGPLLSAVCQARCCSTCLQTLAVPTVSDHGHPAGFRGGSHAAAGLGFPLVLSSSQKYLQETLPISLDCFAQGKHFLYTKDGYKPLIDKRLGNRFLHFVGIFLEKVCICKCAGPLLQLMGFPGVNGAPLWCTRDSASQWPLSWSTGGGHVGSGVWPAFSSPGHGTLPGPGPSPRVLCAGRRTPTLGQQGIPLRGLLEVQVA